MARVKTPEEVLTLIIKHIIARHSEHITPDDPNFAEFLAVRISEIENLKEKIYLTHRKECDQKKKHQEIIANIIKERKELENTCPHYSKTYHGDPSGGRDSHETCDICGKWFE
jgi:hypothetical protein